MSTTRQEVIRITLTMTVTAILGAAVLGGIYIVTARYQEVARVDAERKAIAQMLRLGPTATVKEVREFLTPDRKGVVYQQVDFGAAGGSSRQVQFTLEGQLVGNGDAPAIAAEGTKDRPLLGRTFVATQGGEPAGFVVEGVTRGYKNKVRFLVALTQAFDVAGVRVVEHEEDPGLGAEVATPWFQGQFLGRGPQDVAALTVTRDPMPEDWRQALAGLQREDLKEWAAGHQALMQREKTKPIYAVTGATISSRALTNGVRATVDHFQRRWELVSPYLGGKR